MYRIVLYLYFTNSLLLPTLEDRKSFVVTTTITIRVMTVTTTLNDEELTRNTFGIYIVYICTS